MNKCYSRNGEDFNFTGVCEVLDAMSCDGDLVEGAVYYECDCEEVQFTRYLRAELILDNAGEAIFDDVGECADGAFFVSKEAEQEMDDFFREWTGKHLRGSFWMVVGKSREIKVTTDDIVSYSV